MNLPSHSSRGPGRVLITGGRVLDPSQDLDRTADLLIEGGRIAATKPGLARELSRSTEPLEVLEADGLWVLPGLIDMHVHLREPGGEESETIESGTRAAIRGGVTTVVCMPNTRPPLDSPELLRFVAERALAADQANVFVAAAATVGRKGERLTDFAALKTAGCVAVTDDGSPITDPGLMQAALEEGRRLGLPVLQHCEDVVLPSCAARDIELASRTGGALHLCHVSSADTVRIIREAKKRGVRVTAETCPHYFAFTEEDAGSGDANFKMNPPLRAARDREAVREGLKDGTLDAIASDHAPHAASLKSRGLRSAPFGVTGLETLLSATLTFLVESGTLTPLKAVRALSAAPAAILGLRGRGTLRPGSIADVAVIDPRASWTVGPPFESKSSNSPFLGRTLEGRVRAVMVEGRFVLCDLPKAHQTAPV